MILYFTHAGRRRVVDAYLVCIRTRVVCVYPRDPDRMRIVCTLHTYLSTVFLFFFSPSNAVLSWLFMLHAS